MTFLTVPSWAQSYRHADQCVNEFEFDARSSGNGPNQSLIYRWDLGDGTTSNQPYFKHAYREPGKYETKLTVMSSVGTTCNSTETTREIVVSGIPPKAEFSAKRETCTWDVIDFNASQSWGDPATSNYHWSFGDGVEAEGQVLRKAFSQGGEYPVTLSVSNACGSDSVTKKVKINRPPRADAGPQKIRMYFMDRQDYAVPFDGIDSTDEDGGSLSYEWDFGDGSSGEGEMVSHVFRRAGEYVVNLKVRDDSGMSCGVDTDSVIVRVSEIYQQPTDVQHFTCEGKELVFDASMAHSNITENHIFFWDFNDGNTASGKVARYTYAEGGNYIVTLQVDDGKGLSNSFSTYQIPIVINAPPDIVLSHPAGKVCAGADVMFDATWSRDVNGDSLRYKWDMGDGTFILGGSKIFYSYDAGGIYPVTVTVDDGTGTECSSSSETVQIYVNEPPESVIGPDKTCCENASVEFDGTASGDPDGDNLSYFWNFGDGQSSTLAKPTHRFRGSGTYKVVLTVSDNSGTTCSNDSSTLMAEVGSSPNAEIKVRPIRGYKDA